MKCEFIKQDGTQCKCSSLQGETRCYWHSATTSEKRKISSAKGGSAITNRNRIPLRNMSDVMAFLEETINDVRRFRSPQAIARARAVGYLLTIAISALEKGDIERRICDLEAKLAG